MSTSEDNSLLQTSGEDAVILISGEGAVYLCSMGEQLLLTSGDGDKLYLSTGEDTWVPISKGVEMCLILCEGSGEGVLVPGLAGEAALSNLGEGVVRLSSGETLLSTSSGDVAIEMTGEGGVYRGAGVDTALAISTDNLVPWLSGVVVVSLPAVERSEISSGV